MINRESLTAGFGEIAPRHRSVPLILGLAAGTYLPLIGRLSVLEIGCVLLVTGLILAEPGIPVLGYAYLAVCAVIVAVLVVHFAVNPVPPVTLIKTCANYAVGGLLSLALVRMLLSKRGIESLQWMFIGLGTATCAWALLAPTPGFEDEIWKFGTGPGLTFIGLPVAQLLWARTGSLVLPSAIIGGLSVVHMVSGARSLAFFTLVAAAVPWLHTRVADAAQLKALVVKGGLAVALLGYLVMRIYNWAAAQGTLGESAKEKFENQNGDFGVLLGGRRDLVYITHGIMENGLAGDGAVPTSSTTARIDAYQFLADHNYQSAPVDYWNNIQNSIIPQHSIVGITIARVGIFALPFIIATVYFIVLALRESVVRNNFLIAFLAVSGGWSLMFSPLGEGNRTILAVVVSIGIASLIQIQRDRDDGRYRELQLQARHTERPPIGASERDRLTARGAEAGGKE